MPRRVSCHAQPCRSCSNNRPSQPDQACPRRRSGPPPRSRLWKRAMKLLLSSSGNSPTSTDSPPSPWTAGPCSSGQRHSSRTLQINATHQAPGRHEKATAWQTHGTSAVAPHGSNCPSSASHALHTPSTSPAPESHSANPHRSIVIGICPPAAICVCPRISHLKAGE